MKPLLTCIAFLTITSCMPAHVHPICGRIRADPCEIEIVNGESCFWIPAPTGTRIPGTNCWCDAGGTAVCQ